MLVALIALLPGCYESVDPAGRSPDTDNKTGEDAYWGGGCNYTAAALDPDAVVEPLGVSARQFTETVNGARNTTLQWADTGDATPFDHELTLDAATAQLWTGVWEEPSGGDTGAYAAKNQQTDDTGGTSTGDSGSADTGGTDTGVGADHDCAAYFTVIGTWSVATGDGQLAETLAVTARSESATLAHVTGSVDASALVGTYAWGGENPAEWDELRLEFTGDVSADGDGGLVSLFGSKTDGETAMAMRGDVAGWPSYAVE